jgi:hypothetical protein
MKLFAKLCDVYFDEMVVFFASTILVAPPTFLKRPCFGHDIVRVLYEEC